MRRHNKHPLDRTDLDQRCLTQLLRSQFSFQLPSSGSGNIPGLSGLIKSMWYYLPWRKFYFTSILKSQWVQSWLCSIVSKFKHEVWLAMTSIIIIIMKYNLPTNCQFLIHELFYFLSPLTMYDYSGSHIWPASHEIDTPSLEDNYLTSKRMITHAWSAKIA